MRKRHVRMKLLKNENYDFDENWLKTAPLGSIFPLKLKNEELLDEIK
jgi:hypothetical protein